MSDNKDSATLPASQEIPAEQQEVNEGDQAGNPGEQDENQQQDGPLDRTNETDEDDEPVDALPPVQNPAPEPPKENGVKTKPKKTSKYQVSGIPPATRSQIHRAITVSKSVAQDGQNAIDQAFQFCDDIEYGELAPDASQSPSQLIRDYSYHSACIQEQINDAQTQLSEQVKILLSYPNKEAEKCVNEALPMIKELRETTDMLKDIMDKYIKKVIQSASNQASQHLLSQHFETPYRTPAARFLNQDTETRPRSEPTKYLQYTQYKNFDSQNFQYNTPVSRYPVNSEFADHNEEDVVILGSHPAEEPERHGATIQIDSTSPGQPTSPSQNSMTRRPGQVTFDTTVHGESTVKHEPCGAYSPAQSNLNYHTSRQRQYHYSTARQTLVPDSQMNRQFSRQPALQNPELARPTNFSCQEVPISRGNGARIGRSPGYSNQRPLLPKQEDTLQRTIQEELRMPDTGYQRISHNVSKPKIEIPKFNGDPRKWNRFWRVFKGAIHNDQSLPDDIKAYYLIGALEGYIYDDVAPFLDQAGGGYVSALESLLSRYQASPNAGADMFLDIVSLPNITSTRRDTVLRSTNVLKSTLKEMRDIDYSGYLCDSLNSIVRSKFPKELRDQVHQVERQQEGRFEPLHFIQEIEVASKILDEERLRGRVGLASIPRCETTRFSTEDILGRRSSVKPHQKNTSTTPKRFQTARKQVRFTRRAFLIQEDDEGRDEGDNELTESEAEESFDSEEIYEPAQDFVSDDEEAGMFAVQQTKQMGRQGDVRCFICSGQHRARECSF